MNDADWQVVDALVAAEASSSSLAAAAKHWAHRPALAAQLRREAQLRAAEEEFEMDIDER